MALFETTSSGDGDREPMTFGDTRSSVCDVPIAEAHRVPGYPHPPSWAVIAERTAAIRIAVNSGRSLRTTPIPRILTMKVSAPKRCRLSSPREPMTTLIRNPTTVVTPERAPGVVDRGRDFRHGTPAGADQVAGIQEKLAEQADQVTIWSAADRPADASARLHRTAPARRRQPGIRLSPSAAARDMFRLHRQVRRRLPVVDLPQHAGADTVQWTDAGDILMDRRIDGIRVSAPESRSSARRASPARSSGR